MSEKVIPEAAAAIHKGISTLKDHNVFEEVRDEGQDFIESKWIVMEKSLMENRW